MQQNQCADAADNLIRLQVLIVAYGKKGIESIATLQHPQIKGVEYLVSWQYGDDKPIIPPSLSERGDFRIYPTDTRGVATNRNLVLSHASAPLLLSSDDDVAYTPDQIQVVIDTFDSYPDIDFFTFRYSSSVAPREYPSQSFSLLDKWPKLYYVTGFEMAWRREALARYDIRFNTLFGVGEYFCAGEEDLFVHDVVRNKIPSRFIPVTICAHDSDTTCMRIEDTPRFIQTKGASIAIMHPATWPLRMITHALRFTGSIWDKFNYCADWLKGVRDLRRLNRKRKKQ